MVTQRTYPHGVPCWVEVETRDVGATAAFYVELFGWRFVEQPARGGARYVVASLDGTNGTAVAAVAGVTSLDTALNTSEGDMDPSGKALITYGTIDEYLTGEHDKMVKMIWRFRSADEFAMEVYDLPIGENNNQVFTQTYRRKKG